MTMQPEEKQAVLTIALLAAFADGSQDDHERREVKRAADALATELDAPDLYQQVLMKRVDVQAATAQLRSSEARTLAYEVAVGVCDADSLRNEAETRFLAQLGNALGLGQPIIAATAASADALVTSPPPAAASASIDQPELDAIILKVAITNGALELLPQSLASLAIIPLQMKLVYRIGQAHGYELDRGHIKDLLATLGVGMTGQYLEQIGRKLFGGMLGAVTGVAFSFATTYAIGQVAKRYYAGSRTMNADVLKQVFEELLQQGRALQARYLPQIEQQARGIDVNRLVQLVRGTL